MTAEDLDEIDGLPPGPVPATGSFLDPLVARLSAQYGLDARTVRALAVEALALFADARVQAFVPVLVEKRLRDTCRGLNGSGPIPAAGERPTAVVS